MSEKLDTLINDIVFRTMSESDSNSNRLPDNFPIECNYCHWKGIISDCKIEMDSEGWEYPEYEVCICPKCGEIAGD